MHNSVHTNPTKIDKIQDFSNVDFLESRNILFLISPSKNRMEFLVSVATKKNLNIK
jgi:hypothetical protein